MKKIIAENLSSCHTIAFAYLFGSFAKDNQLAHSDVDIGIYFYPQNEPFDIENDVYFEQEDQIWSELEKSLGREVDLVVLNRSPATVCAAVLQEGVPVFIRDRNLYWDFLLAVLSLAVDFREFEREFAAIKKRSRSLSEIDKNRLIRIIDFLRDELKDCKKDSGITVSKYKADGTARRNIERLVENIVNGSIDVARIVLAAEKKPIPQTYRETIENLKTAPGFGTIPLQRIASDTRLRNILAHEYLDIKYKNIKDFLSRAIEDYSGLIDAVENYIEAREPPDNR